MYTLLIRSKNKLIEKIIFDKLDYETLSFIIKDNKVFSIDLDRFLELNNIYKINEYEIIVNTGLLNKYKIIDNLIIAPNGDIKINNSKIEIKNNILYNFNNTIININGINNDDQEIKLFKGDLILIENIYFAYNIDFITVIGNQLENSNLEFLGEIKIPNNVLQRSPRTFKHFDETKIDIISVPQKLEFDKKKIWKIIIPTLLAMTTTILMGIISKRGILVFIGLITTCGSLIFSIIAYFEEKIKLKRAEEERIDSYKMYLLSQRKILEKLEKNEIEVYNYNYPSALEISKMITNFSSRLYEREILNDDFLTLSLGYHSMLPHYKINYKFNELNKITDELELEVNDVYKHYKIINNVKRAINLKDSHLGIVGSKINVENEMKRMILELAFFHSYHDLTMVYIGENRNNTFDFCRNLPHFHIFSNNLSTFIDNDNLRSQVLNYIYQVLKMRKLEHKDNQENKPYFVLFIEDFKLINNHPIMEFLQNDTEFGIVMILGVRLEGDLTANFKTILNIKNSNELELLQELGNEVRLPLKADSISNIDLDLITRTIAIFEHQEEYKNDIPDMVTFLQMYDVKTIEELNIINRWATNLIHKNMSVPIGMRSKVETLDLNLHEKAHGPHGLVAGTTGSGKSEAIQTYILSLALNFSPEDIQFLLVDFKGGGMANLFKNMPHLNGIITNLNETQSLRAIASIEAEIDNRQKIFTKYDVNNINLYTKKYKNGDIKDPMPHLFIICDEFAEIKAKLPDFMESLVRIARIGRTLGIHLILATQKPAGVVNDQIWSNSKFKLALKVQSEADSKEVIKTPDAAHITQIGRGYLQVGNNELYQLFQSAWSGATYNINNKEKDYDDRIYYINELGQRELLTNDFDKDYEEQELQTELDAVINEISNVYKNNHFKTIDAVCMPPLEINTVNPYLKDINLISEDMVDMNVNVGIIDQPHLQKQENYSFDLQSSQNALIIGSPGMGKTTILKNMILDLSIKNHPSRIGFYLLDFANAGLAGMKNLATVIDYFNLENIDCLKVLENRLINVMNKRRKLFSDNCVQGIKNYEEKTGEKLERIVLVIDNLDNIKTECQDFYNFIESSCNEFSSLGISIIASNLHISSLRMKLTSAFENKFVLYTIDESEYRNALGRSPYFLYAKEYGRALMKQDDFNLIQMYTPFDINNVLDFNNSVNEFINKYNLIYPNKYHKAIPIMPDELRFKDLTNFDSEEEGLFTLGIKTNDLGISNIKKLTPIFQIVGPTRSGKTNLINLICKTTTVKAYVIDSQNIGLISIKSYENIDYINNEDDYLEFLKDLESDLNNLMKEYQEFLEDAEEMISIKDYFKDQDPKLIIIDDVDDFIEHYQEKQNIVQLFEKAIKFNYKFIIGVNSIVNRKACKDEFNFMKIIKSYKEGVILGAQNTHSLKTITLANQPSLGYGLIHLNNELIKIRIPEM